MYSRCSPRFAAILLFAAVSTLLPASLLLGDALGFTELVDRATAESVEIASTKEALSDALEAISPGFDLGSIKQFPGPLVVVE